MFTVSFDRSLMYEIVIYSNNLLILQGSASECTLVTLLAARAAALRKLKEKYPDEEDGVLLSKLVAYCSKQVRPLLLKSF